MAIAVLLGWTLARPGRSWRRGWGRTGIDADRERERVGRVDNHTRQARSRKRGENLVTFRREGVVTTDSHGPSLSARVRTIALAGALAIGGILPAALTASADGGADPGTTGVDTSPATSDGFDISGDSGLSGLTAVIAGGGERVNLRQ